MASSDTVTADNFPPVMGCSPTVPYVAPASDRAVSQRDEELPLFVPLRPKRRKAVTVVVIRSGRGRPQPVGGISLD
jgi:hypothetical protein